MIAMPNFLRRLLALICCLSAFLASPLSAAPQEPGPLQYPPR